MGFTLAIPKLEYHHLLPLLDRGWHLIFSDAMSTSDGIFFLSYLQSIYFSISGHYPSDLMDLRGDYARERQA